jgi:glycosyltransferase involved in cell wall biosynthesis
VRARPHSHLTTAKPFTRYNGRAWLRPQATQVTRLYTRRSRVAANVLPERVSLPAITFAIPYYSGIAYLGRALESVIAQDAHDWQAIVCDDGSETGVEAFVKRVGGGRVRYLRNERNLGIGGNFSRCVDVAETELVTVLHADDELVPTYAATMRAAAARHSTAAALFCHAQIIGPQSEPRFSLADLIKRSLDPSARRELVLAGEPGVRALLRANFIMAPTLCFRKSTLGARRFATDHTFVIDWMLTMQLLLDGDSLVGVPDICYRYRRHADNATERLTKSQLRFHEESEFYDRMRGVCAERGWSDCVAIATEKRFVKLNVTYRALKSLALLDLGEARRGFRLLREL